MSMKKISIKDFKYKYEYDEITCFEHPFIVVLDYIKAGYGRYYAMLSKLNGTYIYDVEKGDICNNVNPRKITLDEVNGYFGINIRNKKNISYKEIVSWIDKDMPVIIAVNLKSIFYSNYYPDINWNHWMLITGYRKKGKVLNILDNSQFQDIGALYEEFRITYDILKKSNKDYVKRYGEEHSVLVFEKNEGTENDNIIHYIIGKYLSLDLKNKKSYRQQFILDMYIDIVSQTDKNINSSNNNGSIQSEFKKKIININKYRMLFLNELKEYMFIHKYNDVCRESFNNFVKDVNELNNMWQREVIMALVKVTKGENVINIVTDKIIELEIKIQQDVEGFVEFIRQNENNHILSNLYEKGLLNKKHSYFVKDNEIPLEKNIFCQVENRNHIFDINGNKNRGTITFLFDDTRVCNWWDMDDAPKILLGKLENNTEIVLNIVEEVTTVKDSNIEIGLFVRNIVNNQNFMIGNENNTGIVFSEIGVGGVKFENVEKSKIRLYIRCKKNVVEFGVYKGNDREVIMEKINFDIHKSCVGIACKTWGKPCVRKVCCNWVVK